MPNDADKKQLRSFGLTVGGVFAAIVVTHRRRILDIAVGDLSQDSVLAV